MYSVGRSIPSAEKWSHGQLTTQTIQALLVSLSFPYSFSQPLYFANFLKLAWFDNIKCLILYAKIFLKFYSIYEGNNGDLVGKILNKWSKLSHIYTLFVLTLPVSSQYFFFLVWSTLVFYFNKCTLFVHTAHLNLSLFN